MEPLSQKARALLTSAQRAETPTAEFRARAERAWQGKAAALGLGTVALTVTTSAAAATSTLSTAAKATSAGTVASGASAMGAAAAKLSGAFALGGVAKFMATAGLLAVAGTGGYGAYLATGSRVEPLPPSSPAPSFVAPADTIPFAPYTSTVVTDTAPVQGASAGPDRVAPFPLTVGIASGEQASQIPAPSRKTTIGSPDVAPSATPPRPPVVRQPLPGGPQAAAPLAQSSALLEHARELEQAHRLLRAGSAEKALELLEGSHTAEAPGAASLAVEREALRIAAMCRLADAGKRASGRALAQSFAAEHPNSPMLERLKGECRE